MDMFSHDVALMILNKIKLNVRFVAKQHFCTFRRYSRVPFETLLTERMGLQTAANLPQHFESMT